MLHGPHSTVNRLADRLLTAETGLDAACVIKVGNCLYSTAIGCKHSAMTLSLNGYWKTSAVLLLLSSLAVNFARAGPERAITISDQPVGNTLSHVYWLRTIDDNESGYDTHLTHVFLVKQDVTTGKSVRHWLVRRVEWSERRDVNDAGKTVQQLDVFEPPVTENQGKPIGSPPDEKLYRNPFEILRSENAAPILDIEISQANSNLARWFTGEEHGLQYEQLDTDRKIDEEIEVDVRLSAIQLKQQLLASITPTLLEMQKFTPNDVRSAIPQSAFSTDLSACVANQEFIPPTKGAPRFLQIECEGSELINWWKLWVKVE